MTSAGGEAPIFSIVISVLNGADTLTRCLDSVLAQSFSGWELVIMDGASTDGTQAVLEQYDAAISYWESEKDRGICHAWNKALGHARGEWVLFLGADDRLAQRDVLDRVANVLPSAEEVRVVYGMVDVVNAAGATTARMGRPWEEAGREFIHHNTLPHQGVFHRRGLFERNGPFDERFRICGDYELLIRELKDHEPEFMPDVVVAEMGDGGISNRPRNALRATREFHRAQYINGLTTVPEWRSFRILRARCYEVIRRTLGRRAARKAAHAYKSLTGTKP